jgi:hypothetical protein
VDWIASPTDLRNPELQYHGCKDDDGSKDLHYSMSDMLAALEENHGPESCKPTNMFTDQGRGTDFDNAWFWYTGGKLV